MVDDQWVFACRLSELEEDCGVRIQLPGGGKRDAVALFLHRNQLFALADRCCHSDKAIHSGDIEDLDDCVISADGERGRGGVCVRCPKHQRKFGGGLYFNLETGEARTPKYTSKFERLDKHHVKIHDVRLNGDQVYVSLRPHRYSSSKRLRVSHETDLLIHEKTLLPRDSQAIPDATLARKLQQRDPDYWDAELYHVDKVTHDAIVFTFRLPDDSKNASPPKSSIWHVTLVAKVGSETIQRDYTPISDWSDWCKSGLIRLLIKIYPDGSMTQHLDKMSLGARIMMSSPVTTLLAPSFVPLGQEPRAMASSDMHLVLLAAGTGVVPMVQVVHEAIQSRKHVRSITLVYACKRLEDRLCQKELEALEALRAETPRTPKFRMWLALSSGSDALSLQAPPLIGVVQQRIDLNFIRTILAEICAEEHVHVVCSGPDGFYAGMQTIFEQSRFKLTTMVDLDA